MPTIPYPDVPDAPGVPDVPKAPGDDSQGTLSEVTVSDSVDTPPQASAWGILDDAGSPAIQPDSFISFEYRGEQKVPNYPVEKGSFSSYNKVALPFDVRVVIACGGKGAMTRQEFTDKLTSMLADTILYSLSTPDAVYDNANLIHVNYRREAKQGVTLLLAELWFDEIRQAPAGTVTTQKPSGAEPQANGQVAPLPPTATQNAAVQQYGGATGTWTPDPQLGGASGSW